MTHLRGPRILAPVALLLAALALGGCSVGGGTSGGEAGPDVGAPVAPQPDFGGGGSDEGATDGGGSGGGSSEEGGDTDAEGDRAVITTGTMTITAEDPIEAAADATRIVERAGGRVDERSEFAPSDGDSGGARLTLRIPADRLTGAIDELRELGEVEHVATSSSDVTREVQDLDARIDALSTSIDRLVALLATADDTEALILLETAVADRQAELESLRAQRRGIADAVSMSTLDLILQSEEVAPVDEPETFLDGLVAGWNALVAVGSTTLVVLGALLPWFAVAGLLLLVLLAIVHLVRRRSRRAGQAPPRGGTSGDGTP